jgi:hypothetical protein
MKKIPKFIKRRAFNKAVRPGKSPKLIIVGPMFIPDNEDDEVVITDANYI